VHIRNETDSEVVYELRGGPVMMTLSKGWIDPGEADEWIPPNHAIGACMVVVHEDDVFHSAQGTSENDYVIRRVNNVLEVTVE